MIVLLKLAARLEVGPAAVLFPGIKFVIKVKLLFSAFN